MLTLLPGREGRWVAAWQELGQRALDDPRSGCCAFQLYRDITDSSRHVLVSEWESRTAFDTFVQSSSALWISRGLEYSNLPAELMYLAPIAQQVRGLRKHDLQRAPDTGMQDDQGDHS